MNEEAECYTLLFILPEIANLFDFFTKFGYHTVIRHFRLSDSSKARMPVFYFGGAQRMKKCNKIGLIIGIVSVAAVVAAAVTAVVLFFDKKKKDEEELEHYLDCSIQ